MKKNPSWFEEEEKFAQFFDTDFLLYSYSQGSPSDETISAVNCALPLEYLVPTPNVNSTSTNMVRAVRV